MPLRDHDPEVHMSLLDLSGGLPVDREQVREQQPSVPHWSDNLLFAVHDPTSGLSMWLHLGTVPDDWSMWHEMVYAVLPDGEGLLSASTFHRTAPERRPAGAGMTAHCVEPFRRWHVTYDGHGLHTPLEEMQQGTARLGHTRRWTVDLEIEGVTPLWDYRTAAAADGGRGGMDEQSWASEHYEQMYRARGTVRIGDQEIAFDGYGWRDHSQGARSAEGGTPWGGHVTAGSVFEDGRGWGATRFWGPDGTVNLEAGWVCDAPGRLHQAQVLEAPSLRQLALAGEDLPFALRWSGGVLETGITTTSSLWLSMRLHLALGRDDAGPGLMFVPAWGTSAWDGLTGGSYVERSNPLNALPEVGRG